MFNFLNINLVSVQYGPTVQGIGITGLSIGEFNSSKIDLVARDLTIPWDEVQANTDVFSLLRWRSRISDFRPNKFIEDELLAWAHSELTISVKFIVGEGGIGKTRLAAEFAETLRADEGWAAGFIDLTDDDAFQMRKAGTLLVIDYPEENRERTREFLHDISRIEECSRLRILFLTRHPLSIWQKTIDDSGASGLVDRQAISLGLPSTEDAWQLFTSTHERCAEILSTVVRPFSQELFTNWFMESQINRRPLFTMAAAVHNALFPDSNTLEFTGTEVMRALVRRETSRWRAACRDSGLTNEDAVLRIFALAAMRGSLSLAQIKNFANESYELGLPNSEEVVDILQSMGVIQSGRVPSPTPDILAAVVVTEAFNGRRDKAADWLWASIDADVANGLERIARLSYDADVTLQSGKEFMHWKVPSIDRENEFERLTDWLERAVQDDLARAKHLTSFIINARTDTRVEVGLLPALVAARKCIARNSDDNPEKAGELNSLSVDLSALGLWPEALRASCEAIKLLRRIDVEPKSLKERWRGLFLNNASNRLYEYGKLSASIAVLRRAIYIREHLATNGTVASEADLAQSLTNLSFRLRECGGASDAVRCASRASEFYRDLAQQDWDRYAPDLAWCLGALSACLGDTGDHHQALRLIREAEKIHRFLAEQAPARFEAYLAISLRLLAEQLLSIGDHEEASYSVIESVEIYERLAQTYSARFAPELARSRAILSNCFKKSGDYRRSFNECEKAAEIFQLLSLETPQKFERDFVKCLGELEALRRLAVNRSS